ncbi:glycosyl hydrolase [Flavobacterium faecale]|uniref:glycosyl hydrolase n=1 Tax=Flavobacterium faecale TaxID=1355330 RepID=UPI003AAEFEBE
MRKIICLLSLVIFNGSVYSQKSPITNLERNFKNPPQESKPRTWMHALDGNMSKEGLTKDFESLANVGIGGVLLFNISYGIPKGKITYNSTEHRSLLKHAAKESERLGLTFGVHNCDGWTSSGGPWVKADQSMKMIVYRDTVVKGGKLKLMLPIPTIRENYYKEVAVLAYPSLSSEIADAQNKYAITTSDSDFNISLLNDHKTNSSSVIKGSETKPAFITYAFEKPILLRSLLINTLTRGPKIVLSVSDDGQNFKDIPEAEQKRTGKKEFNLEAHYDGITAKFVKLKVLNEIAIQEIELSATQTISDRLARISMAREEASSLDRIGSPANDMIIDKNKIINLSQFVDENGFLTAKLPKGNWTIMRFGVTSTGAFNNPASDSGRGLEVDKFDRNALKLHYDAFVAKLVQESKPEAPNAMKYVEIDSYEMGGQNWTNNYPALFQQKFGYDLTSFLPLYAGRFVESAKSVEAVSYDLRKLNSHLMVENYYGYFTELCHADGIQTYIEPYGFGPMDDIAAGGKADIPMGEFWTGQPTIMVSSAVQSARAYGKNIISAEAFTSGPDTNWKGHPAMNKTSGDYIWTQGINEYMFHRFAHQPNTHVVPGMTMGPWGSHFDRTNTWWENAGKAWFNYLARGQYLLRQGFAVSDFLIFPGDASPSPVFDVKLPVQFKSDVTNAEVLINRIQVKNGKIHTPEGIEYRALIIGNLERIELNTLRRLDKLSSQGVVIIGKKPLEIAQYQVSKEQQNEFNDLVASIWNRKTTYEVLDWKTILPELGVTPDFSLEGVESSDFIHRKTATEDIYFIYNPQDSTKIMQCTFNVNGKIPELWNPMTGEIVKLAQFESLNGKTKVAIPLKSLESTFVVFRENTNNCISVIPTSENKLLGKYSFDKNNTLQVEVANNGSYTTKLSDGKVWNLEVNDIPEPITISGEWTVQFRKEDGYEAQVKFPHLTDWKDHAIDSIKHYSGTAIYRKSFSIDGNQLKSGTKFYLNLGKVSIAAKVYLNGKDLGVSWIAPFEIDITQALQKGTNDLVIEVTNLWTNRLIGDEYLPDTSGYKKEANEMPKWYTDNEPQPVSERRTFTVFNFYKKEESKKLVSSGLLGPVQIKVVRNIYK